MVSIHNYLVGIDWNTELSQSDINSAITSEFYDILNYTINKNVPQIVSDSIQLLAFYIGVSFNLN